VTWSTLRFGDVLTDNRRPYVLGPTENADLVGMRLYGLGPFHREYKLASKIRKKSHFVVREGDVIYNKLFAWRGTFGVIPAELDGMFVSDKFPTYSLDETRVFKPFLAWYFRCPELWESARLMSKGSAALSKLTLNPPQFLDLPLRIPSTLDEQRQIVTRIDAAMTAIDEARVLRKRSSSRLAQLPQAVVEEMVLERSSDLGSLSEFLAEKLRNGWSPRCDPSAESGAAVLSLGAITGFRYRPTEHKLTTLPVDSDADYWLREGDLLISRSNTPELVGHAAIYSGEPAPCIYPDLMIRVRTDADRALPEFVHAWLQTGIVRRFIGESATGTSSTMKKISQGTVRAIPFPLGIAIDEQKRIATAFRRVDALVASVSCLDEQVSADLSRLSLSVLRAEFFNCR